MIYNYLYFDYYFSQQEAKEKKKKKEMGWDDEYLVIFPLTFLTLVSDQEIISPYNINIIATR